MIFIKRCRILFTHSLKAVKLNSNSVYLSQNYVIQSKEKEIHTKRNCTTHFQKLKEKKEN